MKSKTYQKKSAVLNNNQLEKIENLQITTLEKIILLTNLIENQASQKTETEDIKNILIEFFNTMPSLEDYRILKYFSQD